MLPRMGRIIRVFEGRFGRLMLTELAEHDELRAATDPAIVLQQGQGDIQFLNPGEIQVNLDARRALVFHASSEWLRQGFPAVFNAEEGKPFPEPRVPMTPRIHQLADALAVEVINDRFLSPERLEFMLQELVLSIVETYLAGRRGGSWRGSRFEDTRIRRAIALLREHPNKDLNMDQLASQVGLSRSRFYDLFQLCTGFSPRTYLDLLCIEAAISRLSSGRGKIAEVSAELGFSAQSNFTRFFLNQVGVPPSEYRRATTRPEPGSKPSE
jgi:AraC-like DNA-binding protein